MPREDFLAGNFFGDAPPALTLRYVPSESPGPNENNSRVHQQSTRATTSISPARARNAATALFRPILKPRPASHSKISNRSSSAAGLNLENVVYVQVYLEDVNNYDRLNTVFAKYFPKTPPARAVLGVAKVPQGSIEITAVAVRDLAGTKSRHARKLQVDGTIFPRHPHPRSLVRLRHAGPRSEIRRRPRRSCRAN